MPLSIRTFMAIWLLVAMLSTGGCRNHAQPVSTEPVDRPNIVLISIESLRPDHVGCYGYEQETTPNIDTLAATATRFDDAHSVTSWTLTAHASMFTGLYPSAHQVILPRDRLGGGYRTIAEALSEVGYQCAGVVGGPYLRKPHNLNQGFEYYDQSVSSITDEEAHKDITNPRMEEAIRRFLVEQRDPKRPFFLFCYYWDVHYDYLPPTPYNTMFVPPGAETIESVAFNPVVALGRDISRNQLAYLVGQYDGEIRCTDDYLGRLWTLLRKLGLWDRTAVILTADHGEEFFEHGFLGHKNTLHAESIHVPLIVKLPDQNQAREDARLVNLVDLYPTIVELAGSAVQGPCHGRSLLRPQPEADRASFYELVTSWTFTNRETGKVTRDRDDWVAVRRGRHKLLRVKGTDFWQLYDVVADPEEKRPLGADHVQIARQLRTVSEQWEKALLELATQWQDGAEARLSEQEIERLRALGYVQ